MGPASMALSLGFGEYQQALTQSVYPIRLDLPGTAAQFKGELALAKVGDIAMIRAHAGDGFHCIQQPMSARTEDPRLILKMQIFGSTSYRHVGQNLQCGTGDIALLSDDNIIEGEQHGPADALVVKLPKASVRAMAPRVLSGIGQSISTQTPSGRLLAMMLHEIWAMAGQTLPRAPGSLFVSLLHLIDASIDDGRGSSEEFVVGRADDRFRRLCDLVAARCTYTDLSIEDIARDAGMSRSTMFETARAAGTSVERLIIAARVKKAMLVLVDPAQVRRTITTIAYDLGFKHPSHFTRVFIAHTGKSPQAYRLDALSPFQSPDPSH